jgi:AcrR family transcriptional regulator
MSRPAEGAGAPLPAATSQAPAAGPPPDGILPHPSTPRSLRVHEEVLLATGELLKEGGLAAATVDAISARSGVSKATIYKHWPSRPAVAAEAFGRLMADVLPLPDTGSATGDLTAQVRQVSAFYATQPMFAQLLAACVVDPGGAAYFRRFFLSGRRAAIAELWERGVARGEVDPAVDADTATDLLFGPLIFRLMTGHRALSADEADKISSAALHGLLRASVPSPVRHR